MTVVRKQKLNELIDGIVKEENRLSIILLNGGFGFGKSEFLRNLIEELGGKNYTDAFCRFDFRFDKSFIDDFLVSFEFVLPGSDSTDVTYDFDESTYNRIHLRELLDTIEESDAELYNSLLGSLLPEYYHFESSGNLSDKEIEERLGKVIEKKGDSRFLLQHNRVIAESFLVDLMNLFYPLDEKFPFYSSYLSEIQAPVRIFIVFDNIDTVAYSALKWLNDNLLPLFINGTFGELISYDINEELESVEISKFFDFRFILSSRVDILLLKEFDFFQSNGDKINSVELNLMLREETKDYLAGRNIDVSYLDLMFYYSSGLPFLIDLLVEFNADEINEVVRDSIYEIFTEKLLDSHPELVQESIKMSAFINEFDEDYLRCNRIIADRNKDAFNYLKFTNDLYTCKNNRLSLKEPFKRVLSMSLERSNKSDIIEYRNIAVVYRKTKGQYPKLRMEELNILRSLAYFKNFDMTLAIDLAFDDKSVSAKNFVKSHSEFFIRNKHTLRLKEEEHSILDEYNKIIDRQKYELKKQFILNIWQKREKGLKSELDKTENSLSELSKKSKVYGDDPSKVKLQYDNHQKSFIEKENDLINLRKKLENYSYNKYVFSLVVNFTAAVMSFIVGYFFPELFSTPKNHSSIIIIQYILYFISCVFLFMGVNFIYKIIKSILNKKVVQKIQDEINILDEERMTHREEMSNLKSILSDWQKNVNEINEEERILKEKVKEIKELLSEEYV
jgi:DNA polymerase III delta prime subunit